VKSGPFCCHFAQCGSWLHVSTVVLHWSFMFNKPEVALITWGMLVSPRLVAYDPWSSARRKQQQQQQHGTSRTPTCCRRQLRQLAGCNQTDEFGMVGFVPPTSVCWRDELMKVLGGWVSVYSFFQWFEYFWNSTCEFKYFLIGRPVHPSNQLQSVLSREPTNQSKGSRRLMTWHWS